jgi:hypothetical protein
VTLRTGLFCIEVLATVLAIAKLVKFKREVDSYRPPSPLPKRRGKWGSPTITKASW